MKLVTGVKSTGRAQTRERQRRGRLTATTMRALYPKFASLRLDFEFKDDAPFTPVPQVNVLHPPAPAYFVFACPYADCDGQFDLTTAVAELASSGDTQRDGQLKCCGERTAARNGRGPCQLMLEYSLTVQTE
jgi:hypothetical protein